MLSLSFIKEIEKIIGRENVLTGEADRQNYAYDAAVLPPVVPGLVVRPTRTDQLGPLIQKCYEEGIPITIRGSGTNLSGGTIPDSTDAVIILTNSLDRILEINEEEMYAVVEPGVITCDLAAAVAARGLFYPPDPGSMSVSTMGGNIAENSGGLRGLKYGTTKKYVMGLEVLTETGEIMKTGACGRGCEYGYNLTELLVASEGTLALTSKAVLKLVTPPKASKAMMAIFPEVKRASQAVAGIIAAHVVPCTLEFMDNMTINLVEDDVKIGDEQSDKNRIALIGRNTRVRKGAKIASGEIVENK